MMRRFCFGLIAATFLIGSIFAAPFASAQSFSFPVGGFSATNVCANSSPIQGCQILTAGSPNQPQVVGNGILRLTTADRNQHAAAWFSTQQPLASGFTTAFQFQITPTNSCDGCSAPADGIALVIQNDPAGTGALGFSGNGQDIAYGNGDLATNASPGYAIRNSLAIELDAFQNADYGDPDGNHIAVQSCGPNNANTLSANSADHNYICPDGKSAKLALQSLPAGLSLADGGIHTITVNYLPPVNCAESCNNLSVYFDSTLILQTTVDITQQLNLGTGGSAYVGLTASTGFLVDNNDIVSWSFSQWPLAPITINQPVQPTVTNFSYTSSLNAITDYSQSGLPAGAFAGLFMQGTVQTITDQQFTDLVANTPFQGSSCQRQDTGNGNFACVTTTDLCTNPANSVAAGINCLDTGTNPLISVSNTYNLDPAQKPVIAPGYIMGKDTALSCGADADNTCKGLVSIFSSISGDALTTGGHTKNFNSVLIPILGNVQPGTSVTTTPPLNGGWVNGNVSVNFNSIDAPPSNNTNPPSSLPTVTSIQYTVAGSNVPSPASGTLPGASGSINIPVTTEGTTTITYSATDSAGIIETVVTNSGNSVSSASPTFTIKTDLTAPTVSCTPPAAAWQANDVTVPCTASDNGNGSGLVGPSSFSVQTNVPSGTETNGVTIPAVTVKDVAGNTSAPQPTQGAFGPFEVDKKPPVITGPTISPASPVFGQAVSASYECTDGGSGVVLCGPNGSSPISATGDTGSITGAADSTVGTHSFTINAKDQVGNASAASSVSYTVGKATPAVTWATPAPTVSGTPLSATQLNATANVPGKFVYTPPAGTILAAGTQTLSVAFTPTDTSDYTSASAHVTLLVTQPVITISPSSINFGTVARGKTSTQVVTLSNPGNANLNLSRIAIRLGSGTDSDDFTFKTNCKSTLAAGASCGISVTFYADDSGTKKATLMITDNAAGSPQSVPLTGTVGKNGR